MDRKPSSKVSSADAGAALADWLAARFTYLSRPEWIAMIEEGRIRVNGASSGAEEGLASGDSVSFDPPPYEEPEVDASFAILWEDEDYLVVDKSGSLPCHPGGRFFEHSLWRILSLRYGFIHIATRLDRETSGLVLACKSPASASRAQRLSESGSLAKEYIAMVHDAFPASVEAEGYIVADAGSRVRKKRRFVAEDSPARHQPGAKACSTELEGLACVATRWGPISLALARPRTGRTHQIRATLLALGYPIVGDKLYGLDEGQFLRYAEGFPEKEDGPGRLVLPSQALHCGRLSFPIRSGERISLRSEPRWGHPYELFPQLP